MSNQKNPARFRSKTLTAALAFLFGSLGAHRFYLYGFRDVWGWANLAGTLLGIPGVLLLMATERASILGWILAPIGANRCYRHCLPPSSTGCAPTPNGTRSSMLPSQDSAQAARAGP